MRGGPPQPGYRWFCRLGLEGRVPDHSTFSKNRHGRFRESDLFRHLFEAVVQRCLDAGLSSSPEVLQQLSEPEVFGHHAGLATCLLRRQRQNPGRGVTGQGID